MSGWYEREMGRLEAQLDKDEITDAEFSEYMAVLNAVYQQEREDAAQSAYDNYGG